MTTHSTRIKQGNKAKVLVGYVYMTKPAVIENMDICKIGRTGNPAQRLSQYGIGRFMHAVTYVSDQFECEIAIKVMFAKCYKPRVDLGAEYFEGDIDEMMASDLHVVQEYSIEEPEPRAYIPRHGMNRTRSPKSASISNAMECPEASKLVPDVSQDIVVPYCEEIHIDDETFKQLHGAIAHEKHSSSEIVIVHPIGEDGSEEEPYSVPLHALTRAQAFAHDLAYKKYKIDRPFNKAFFDEYIKDANSNEGRKRALELFFTWRRLCDLSRTKQDNQERYAKIIMDRRHALDRNFTLHYDTQQDEYHNKLIFGQEMIEALVGTKYSIQTNYEIKHETFKERVYAYIRSLSKLTLLAIVTTFNFDRQQYKDINVILDSDKRVCEFVKRILRESFAISTVHSRRVKMITCKYWVPLITLNPKIISNDPTNIYF